jgi:uncharacterized protein YodC (DUF2158 family)
MLMSDKIKMGDVVMVKSGGPKMTVVNIEDNVAYCIWFDNENKKVTANVSLQAPRSYPGLKG